MAHQTVDQTNLPTHTLQITGMDCSECARTIERGVSKLAGVEHCTVNLSTAQLRVSGTVAASAIMERVRQLGYDVADAPSAFVSSTTLWSSLVQRLPSTGPLGFVRFLLARQETTLALFGLLLVLPGLLLQELLPFLKISSPFIPLLSICALLVVGYPVARSAWRALIINHEVTINGLMTIAAMGAVGIGAYTEAGVVMVLFAIGEALEGYTMSRARDAIRSLLQVAPNQALVLRPCIDCQGHMGQDGYSGGPCPFCGVEEQVAPVEQLLVGDVIVVRPGERIAMDGRILKGASSINQAPITGESTPVDKLSGDEVFAGSINGEGVLEIEVLRLANDNTLSRIIRMVEAAEERRAKTHRLVDRFAKVYTPVVIGLATLLAVVPPLFFGAPFLNPNAFTQGWLYRALELLVVACPCALVISTPVSLISAISNAARQGILFKGGAALEALSQVQAIAFDKTGTLTEGRPTVVAVRAVDCQTPEPLCPACADLLALASAVELRSEHPMARAVVAAAQQYQLQGHYPVAENVIAQVGQGVYGTVNGQEVIIGSHAYFDRAVPHSPELCNAIIEQAAQGQTLLLVKAREHFAGYIAVADTIRASSRAAIVALQQAGINTLVMLTGDNESAAQAIANHVGGLAVQANLLPADKVQAVQALRRQHKSIAMVGDGINDAPALATANVGVAMGTATAQAMETADITLMSDDLCKLPFALQISRAAMRTIRTNIAFSIGVKLIFLGLVLAGLGTMWLAVLADVGAALLVTLNGMRLLTFKTTPQQ